MIPVNALSEGNWKYNSFWAYDSAFFEMTEFYLQIKQWENESGKIILFF
jgi:hypothetical protein